MLTIINRSAWPDWFVRPVCEWVAERAGINWPFTITLKRAVRPEYWRGINYGKHVCNVTYHRRGTGTKERDHRFRWSPAYHIKAGAPMLVYLIAHEMYHSTGGHPQLFRLPNGRTNRDLMEFKCNEFGQATANEYAAWWAENRPRLMAKMRRARERHRLAADRAAERESPDAKIDLCRKRIAEWERRARLAANRAAKYRRSLRAMEAARRRREAVPA